VSLRTAVDYVAAVYLLVLITTFAYMWLIGAKIGRLESQLDQLEQELDARQHVAETEPVTVE